jgi:predicted dehydrogenase
MMKVIQLGIGGMGDFWINIVRRFANVEYAGFVEVSDEIARQQIAKYDLDPALIFPSLEEALAKVSADAVINVTPPQFHLQTCSVALEAGLPVLCEKPLAHTRADAHALADKASSTGVLLMVAQNYRYSAVAATVKSVLDAGELGAVSGVAVEFYKAPRLIGFREFMAQPLIVDMAIHHFDMLRYFLGADPVRVYAQTWNPPWSWYKGDASAIVTAAFASGAHVSYTGSWCAQGRETPWNAHWRFECERGILLVEHDQVYLQTVTGVEDRGGYYHTGYGNLMQLPLVDLPLQAQDYLLREFYEAIKTGKPPATSAQDNIHTIDFVFDAVDSADSGAPIVREMAG